jgi:hypothetical protein
MFMSDSALQSESIPSSLHAEHGPRWTMRFFVVVLPILGIACLAYIFGMVMAIKQTPPFHSVRDALLAICSLTAQQHILADEWPKYAWYPAADAKGGVLHADSKKIQGDYTLFTSADACTATLIDNAGMEVHRWEAPFWKVFSQSQSVPTWVTERFIVMRRAIAYPNGDLLALYETVANTPSGCGLAKMNVDGKVLWSYDEYAHHDVEVGPDGRIYVLVHELRRLTEQDGEIHSLTDLPVIEDCLAILDSEGREQARISLLDALVASPYFRPLLTHVDRYGDVTHNNTVHLVGDQFASHYPEISPGDLMVCMRNLNLVAVVNLETESIVWATNGPWEHPHDPDPLPNGNIMIFNNFITQGASHGSAVMEFDPRTRETPWQYTGQKARHLRSDTRGCQQQLASGNVLITEGDRGRIVEVTRSGTTVWEFVHPLRAGEAQQLLPLVCGAVRYEAQELPFLKELPQRTQQFTSVSEGVRVRE